MRRETLRKLAMSGAIVGLGAWLLIPRVLGRIGPAEAHAAAIPADAGAAGADTTAQPAPDSSSSEWQELAAYVWPENPFSRERETKQEEARRAPELNAAPARHPVLSAIVSGLKPRALVDGRIVTLGDRLADGSIVTAIGSYSVSLQGPQGTQTLELTP